MQKNLISLNKIFVFELVSFVLIVLGILPRSVVPYFVAILALYVVLASLEDATLFFVRSIPLFIAIPITSTWDNFNAWRILILIIFLRWLVSKENFSWIVRGVRSLFKNPKTFYREHPVLVLTGLLGMLGALSLIDTVDIRAGIGRIIYFANLFMVGIVIYDISVKKQAFIPRVIRNIAIPTIIVILVGYIQVISTYLIDVYQFMRLWGENIQLNQFGTIWSEIAVSVGNTWLAYYGPQLSLRVFSLFPDSHSFPIFVLLGIPALFALSIDKVLKKMDSGINLKRIIKTRARLSVVWIPLALLIVILSGTRGIWVASIPALLVAVGFILYLYRKRTETRRKNIFKYISLYMVLFFMLFSVAYPIFVSPQFLLSKGDLGLLSNRIKSIIDLGETSNAHRIKIWKSSLESIKERPLLGVGIGNFPIVLNQDIFLAKVGSSAHNIYIHIAAEMGLLALAIAIALIWILFARTCRIFIKENDTTLLLYFGSLIIYFPWVMAYLMTDAALFDERAFLLFVVTSALIISKKNP
jgi:O-antigen ligase